MIVPNPALEPLYTSSDGRFLPSALTRGPWSPGAQHGGPPAALMAHLLENFDGGETMFLARTTIELLRPVPLTLLAARVRLVRPGKKVQLIEASLWANGDPGEPGATEVVRALGLRLRRGAVTLPDTVDAVNAEVDDRDAIKSLPHEGVEPASVFASRGFHSDAVELRFVKSTMGEQGAGTMWGRLLVPLVGTEPARGVPLAVAISDFGNAVSSVVSAEEISFINADLTVSLHREPVGEWICLDSVTRVSSEGFGQAMTTLHDLDGPIGRACATLLLEHR